LQSHADCHGFVASEGVPRITDAESGSGLRYAPRQAPRARPNHTPPGSGACLRCCRRLAGASRRGAPVCHKGYRAVVRNDGAEARNPRRAPLPTFRLLSDRSRELIVRGQRHHGQSTPPGSGSRAMAIGPPGKVPRSPATTALDPSAPTCAGPDLARRGGKQCRFGDAVELDTCVPASRSHDSFDATGSVASRAGRAFPHWPPRLSSIFAERHAVHAPIEYRGHTGGCNRCRS